MYSWVSVVEIQTSTLVEILVLGVVKILDSLISLACQGLFHVHASHLISAAQLRTLGRKHFLLTVSIWKNLSKGEMRIRTFFGLLGNCLYKARD